jgi:hypothetical protein
VALTIDTNEFPPHVLLIRGTASLETVDGAPQDFLDGAHKAMDDQTYEHWSDQVKELYKQMVRITITPQWAKFMDFETSAPQAVEDLAREEHVVGPNGKRY